ncbi:MAG TPA: 3-dehydroquinate synthase [Pirellulaceae bacterium]|nr:3-dehydroquinate synthase [Pirellulaceae bacterium]HMO93184.1 3-dehydroquinate synthase [Pirellulaceae bacterium]HMP69987.1 3-dehydroquinate synthase [Pirellulaceae bacterium]
MEIVVDLKTNPYKILIRDGMLNEASSALATFRPSSLFVLADQHVADLYAARLMDELARIGRPVSLITFAAGETSKSIDEVQRIWGDLLKKQIDRQSLLIALGGGVTGDLAGFVAATILRGVRYVQIPTSLLAQVDSSVGGKVGINLAEAKNIVGSFWQPSLVLIDPALLHTLDKRQFVAGMAEVIKYAVIMDSPFFDYIEQHADEIQDIAPSIVIQIIATCCQLKAQIVQQDERETFGKRIILNYGHTFGHAIEQVFGYGTYLHGEAISIGMTMAARLAEKLKICAPDVGDRQTRLFARFGLPTELRDSDRVARQEEILDNMLLDKKNVQGEYRLVLPTRIGEVMVADGLSRDTVAQAFA